MFRIAWIALAIGCHGSPAPSTTAPPPPPPAEGSSAQGNGSTGSFGSAASTGSATTTTTTTTTTGVECEKKRCGPQLGMMSKQCSDGSMGGPTGRCLEHADKTCGWEIRACP